MKQLVIQNSNAFKQNNRLLKYLEEEAKIHKVQPSPKCCMDYRLKFLTPGAFESQQVRALFLEKERALSNLIRVKLVKYFGNNWSHADRENMLLVNDGLLKLALNFFAQLHFANVYLSDNLFQD